MSSVEPTETVLTPICACANHYSFFLVDNTPIRVFKNAESLGVPFPKNQPMKIYSSLWNADDWATRGGLMQNGKIKNLMLMEEEDLDGFKGII
ncbi:hypothetical protein KY285_009580 [Solanum tuberosum]|nr:hypothetical protein KY285_009580 [Solanum tuberosum]